MNASQSLEILFRKHGCDDFRWIKPKKIIVSHWVRTKCIFGCNEYGKNACCPPNLPSVSECRQFFREYKKAVIFRFEKTADKPEDRFQWTRQVNLRLQKLERDIFLTGLEKAFLLFMDSCAICTDCPGSRTQCKNPKSARPSPEAMAVDVFSTVRSVGYPIQVLAEYSQKMNRYAFLMIE